MIRIYSELCLDCARRIRETKPEEWAPCYPCRVDQDLAARLQGFAHTLTYGTKSSLTKMIQLWMEAAR